MIDSGSFLWSLDNGLRVVGNLSADLASSNIDKT